MNLGALDGHIYISKNNKGLARAAMGHLHTLCEVGGKKCLKLIPMGLCDSLRVYWGHWGDVFISDGSVRVRPVVRNARERRVRRRGWPSKGHRWLVGVLRSVYLMAETPRMPRLRG